MSKRTLLIDGDTLIFEAAAANEYDAQWDEWLWTRHGDLNAARAQLDGSLAEIKEKLNGDRMIIALSDVERWRPKVMETYKGNRKERKPTTYGPLREYCHEKYEVFQRPTLEGDDVLGILATHPKLVPGPKVVVSIDKDLKTIPGHHLNYAHAREIEDWESMIRHQREPEADYFHLFQTLTGDRSDGYPGCPKVGAVNAERLLMPCLGDDGTFSVINGWKIVVEAYRKQGLGEEIALQNARVARICRHTDYDFKKKEVILWQP